MIGIENVNEFYTHHYLSAILGGEVRGHLDQFRHEGEASLTPWRRLARLQQQFFRHLETLERVRAPEERVRAHRRMTSALLEALGYAAPGAIRRLESGPLPVLDVLGRANGEPLLWLIPAPMPRERDAAEGGVLAASPLRGLVESVAARLDDFEPEAGELRALRRRSYEELVGEILQLEEPPRFVLLLSDREWLLIDRGKWPEQRLLRFDWREILGRRDPATLEAVTALLHREALAPTSGTSLVDTFDDSSHKHAYEVSEDLKYALQESIEAIGNEAIRYRREVSKKKVFGEEIEGPELAKECIRYMYRLLFVLYIEARPELGYAPMGSDAYRMGYSFERLRDLELLELETEEARQGFTLHLWLRRLFELIYHGTPEPAPQTSLDFDGDDAIEDAGGPSITAGFRLEPLRSHLFDPRLTPFLNRGQLRNHVLLKVIRSMSLSKPQGKGKARRRGRISYATLGINQLGAVYEALLSFRGFFAEETLFEVKPAKVKSPDAVRDPAFFVAEGELGQYSQKERVFDDGVLRRYERGTFIYRMAGRDRQKSASYYTPEVLTRCLVKYALKELLENEDGSPKHAKAEELLDLTICEPAMGSAAFLNEAINQLAERYLTRRQQELGERIAHDRYAQELQQVRMYLADNNVFGVDLNPVAAELAEVSLWLNAIYTREAGPGREVFVPWFGGQLCVGNSLVGAWRKVFSPEQLDAGSRGKSSTWLDAVPERVPLGEVRPRDSVLHFLLPDRGMAVYGQGSEGKPIREMCAAELQAIKEWRNGVCAPLSDGDREALVRLSDAADRLWSKHAELLAHIRERTTDPQAVYGHEHPLAGKRPSSTREKDEIWRQEMASEQVRASSPYRRLKLAMDYWCALWFWPIEQADLLPDRDEWLTDLALLLDRDVLPSLGGGEAAAGQRELFPSTMPADEAREMVDELGFADVEKLIERWPRLRLADSLARSYRFHHWELDFADLFLERGGFDLILGNPPWVPVQWKEADVLGDKDPSFVIDKLSAKQTAERRETALSRLGMRDSFLTAHEDAAGTQAFLSARNNYPTLYGSKVNLYKGFIPLVWAVQAPNGVSGILHPEKVYDEPAAGLLRKASYTRLRQHFQFQNELKLFAEVHNQTRFSINIYADIGKPCFITVANIFYPNSIDECYSDDGSGPIPGIKSEDNQWNIHGHKRRLVYIEKAELTLFATLLDKPGTPPEEARLPAVHSAEAVESLRSFASTPMRLGDLPKGYYRATEMWHESRSQRDGTIRRETLFSETADHWTVSGPHFFIGNPLYKTPKTKCSSNKAYDVIDLCDVPNSYLPRTNYIPSCPRSLYLSRQPKLPWKTANGLVISDLYRIVVPNMIGPGSERTLQAAILMPGPGHIHTVNSYAFKSLKLLLQVAACWISLPFDFFVKSTGAGHFQPNLAERLPLLAGDVPELRIRTLMLNCLTTDYVDLWSKCWSPDFLYDQWSIPSERLDATRFKSLTERWERRSACRDHFSRRMALIEIDVIIAMALGWSLSQLQSAYRTLFFVMKHYERDTWYDMSGRIVFTNNGTGLPGVGLNRTAKKDAPNPCWNDVKHMAEEAGYTSSETVTQVVMDDTLPGGPREKTVVYQAPWIRCDREKDYEVAWKHFEKRFAEQGRQIDGEKVRE